MSDLKKISEKLGSDRDSLYDSVRRLEDRVTTYLDGAEKEQKDEKNRRLKSLEDKLEASKKQVQAKFAGTTSAGVSGGKGFSGLLGGIGAGIGGALTGLAGVAALATLGLSLVDADKIKSNVETLLSIGDRYEGDAASIAARLGKDGAVIIGLNALGGALVKFAAGGAFNAGVDYFAGDWAENVAKNVNSILSIGDNFNLTTLKGFEDAVKAAALPAFLGALGKGLTLFALGGAATGTSDGINEFIGIGANNWAKNVKDNVETLLSINIGEGVLEKLGSVLKAGALVAVMTQLGLGLGAFAVGGVATGISNFLNIGDGDNWGETVKSNVESLLSIGNLKTATLANVSGVMASLSAIGGGLAIFGGGAAIAGVGQGVAEVQQSFSIKELKEGINFLTNGGGDGPSNWAEGLVKNVKTLLSIGDITNLKNVSEFAGAMTAIASGLAVFGVGTAIGGVGVAVADIVAGIRFLSGSQGEDSPPVGWVNQLKTDINNLLSINFDNAGKFAANMGLVAAGLGAFFGSQALSSVLDLGSKIIDFIGSIFTGKEAKSPIDQIVDGVNKIGNLDDNNITKLDAFAKGLDKLFIAFRQFGEADLGDAFTKNITKMVENIAGVLSMWPYLVNGKTWDNPTSWGGLTDNVDFGMGLKKFLAAENMDDIETVDRAIRKLYDALDPSISISPAQVQPVPSAAGAGGGSTAVIGGNQTTNNTTTNNNIVKQAQPQVVDYYDETSRRYGRK